MGDFKKIKLTPLTPLRSGVIPIRKSAKMDITSLTEEQRNELLQIAQREARKVKGAIITGGLKGKETHVMTQLKPAEQKPMIFSFPEPNPVRIYYDNANRHLEEANKAKTEFYQVPATNPQRQFEIYSVFFGEVSLGIASLIMTIEAFMNQLLSDEEEYEIDGAKKTKDRIEKMDFNKKIREVIPVITGVDYVALYEKTHYANLSLANSKRDQLIHLKKVEETNLTNYQVLFKQLLDLNLNDISDSVFHFINTIKPNYFELT